MAPLTCSWFVDCGWNDTEKVPFCKSYEIFTSIHMWNIVPTEYEPRNHLSLKSKKISILPICFGYYVRIEHGNLHVMYHKLSIPFQSFSASIVWLQHSINLINPTHIPVARQNTIRLLDFHILSACSCGFMHSGE